MDTIVEIKKLKLLLDQGAITSEEYNFLKKKVLSESLSSSEPQTKSPVISQIDKTPAPQASKNAPPETNNPANKALNSTETDDHKNEASDDPTLKSAITQKEALKMLNKMDVGFAQQNLIYYAQVGDFKKVELLLIAGLNPNETWFNDQQKRNIYPLHNTAGFGKPKMVKLLVNYGAEIDLEDEQGFTALYYAIEHGTLAAVKVLVESGANLNHKAKNKNNPLYFAKRNKKHEIVEFFIKAGAEELPANEIKSLQRRKMVKIMLIAAVVTGICFFIGNAISGPSSGSSSSSTESSTDHIPSLHCKFCKKVVYGKPYEDIICYTIEPDGIGIVIFNSGTKYAFCSEKCAEIYRSIE